MAFGVAGIAVKDNVAVDLTVRGVGSGEGGQHRAVNGGGAVGPGQRLGEVPQDAPGVFSGGRRTVAENLIAAELNGGATDIDEDGGAQRRDDVDAVELGQRDAGTIEIAAVQRENIQSRVGADQVQLVVDYLAGTVGR